MVPEMTEQTTRERPTPPRKAIQPVKSKSYLMWKSLEVATSPEIVRREDVSPAYQLVRTYNPRHHPV
jgi:hypothetical protein